MIEASIMKVLNKLSRGGLTTPSTDLVHYVAKSFTILDCVESILLNSELPERKLSEYVLNCKNAYPDAFLCNNLKDVIAEFIQLLPISILTTNKRN